MIKLPKSIIQAFFFVLLLIAIIHLFFAYNNSDNLDFFNYSHTFYLSILIGSIYLTLYQKKEKGLNLKKNFDVLKSPFLTLIILIVGALVFSVYIIKLIEFGFQDKVVLYWQISIIILAVLSSVALIRIHVNLINNK